MASDELAGSGSALYIRFTPPDMIEYTVEEGVGGNATNQVRSIMREPGRD